MSRILSLDDSDDPEIVGQLGAQLAKLAKNGVQIVDGFVVPAKQKLEDGMSNEILAAFDRLGSQYVILRSSVDFLDYDTETLRNIQRNNLIDAISYLQQNNARRGRFAAIIVQRDLTAEVSGTIHSINPVTGDRKEILIEAHLWMNETILDGESEPDMIILNKRTGALMDESIDQNEICLTPQQILQLHALVRKVEDRLGEDVSIDWAFDNGALFVLRARPMDDKTIERFT